MHSSTSRTLLVPLDGSSLAEQALAPAARLAKSADASLHLVLVEPPVSIMAGEQERSDGPVPGSPDELRSGYRQYLASMAEALSTGNGVRTHWALLAGWVPRSLAAYIGEHDVDLTVMTTHGRSGFSRFWLGSVASELLHRVTSPVLLLRPSDVPPSFERVLMAVDESPASEKALQVSVGVGLIREGSRIMLAEVVEPPPATLSRRLTLPTFDRTTVEREAAVTRVEQLALRLRAAGLDAHANVVVGAGVAERILELARAEGSDLIVVGTHGAVGVERLLLGSVADKVVRGATQPVLVVPARAGQPGQK
jgi:nucleotide-binding universal stress UspA family protein